jgi:hypothetical protein
MGQMTVTCQNIFEVAKFLLRKKERKKKNQTKPKLQIFKAQFGTTDP